MIIINFSNRIEALNFIRQNAQEQGNEEAAQRIGLGIQELESMDSRASFSVMAETFATVRGHLQLCEGLPESDQGMLDDQCAFFSEMEEAALVVVEGYKRLCR